MLFSFERGLCYHQYIAAVTSLGFVWNAWLSKRLFFFSLVFVRGASALRPDSGGGEGLFSSTRADTRLWLTFATSFIPDIYAGTLFCLSLLFRAYLWGPVLYTCMPELPISPS